MVKSQEEWMRRSQKIATGLPFPDKVDYHDACGHLCCEAGDVALNFQQHIVKEMVGFVKDRCPQQRFAQVALASIPV
eukprot:6824432-Lingulodinium_polyedra.AAC.1